jgi:hypothetical protein
MAGPWGLGLNIRRLAYAGKGISARTHNWLIVTEMSIGLQGPGGTRTAVLNGTLGGLLPRS